MHRHLGEGGRPSSRDTGSTRSGRPSGHVPGCPVPTYVHTAIGDHLHGGCPSWSSGAPRGPQLGHTGIINLAICSSDSGARFLKSVWPCDTTWEHSGLATSSTGGHSPIHSYTSGRKYNGFDQVLKQVRMPNSVRSTCCHHP